MRVGAGGGQRFHWKRAGRQARGQALVEFALVIPLVLVLITGMVEFGFAFNALLATNFASRDAALVAAEAGNASGADCVILQTIEEDINTRADMAHVTRVDIYWADQTGTTVKASNVYTRGGSTTCMLNGANITVPYTASSIGYADVGRCSTVTGCGGTHTPSVDTIGVKITYDYQMKTPLRALTGNNATGGWTIVQSNAMRMEPIL
jgi:Flp pilus assembly protein TadG